MKLNDVKLDDKYELNEGQLLITGTQALVKSSLVRRYIDNINGLKTAGFVSGYRGSPLGAFDQQLNKASSFLKENHIIFNPGLNEELAATSIWGTQQIQFHSKPLYDGVFGIWYGKGPGVDRSGDALRHGNLAGTNPFGGVICLMGDDHTCESSTTAHQSEFAFVDAMIPILSPSNVKELLDFCVLGIELSRRSGCWVGIKCVKDIMDASSIIDFSIESLLDVSKTKLENNEVNIKWPDSALDQEDRLHNLKIPLAKNLIKKYKFNKIIKKSNNDKVGIVSTGKSYPEVISALQKLDINIETLEKHNICLLKIGCPWPLEKDIIEEFCNDLDIVVIVEEKRSLVEFQIKELLYNQEKKPLIIGKKNLDGSELFRTNGSISVDDIYEKLSSIFDKYLSKHSLSKLNIPNQLKENTYNHSKSGSNSVALYGSFERTPYFCSGCPHNTGTKIPKGSKALAGIGCHFMAQWMDRDTLGFTQMGGEGASWIGESNFVELDHVFQNMGDGTYVHSGALAIRAAVAANTNITFKILYNDAVAMTGGQQMDGPFDPIQICKQLLAENVKKVYLISDDIDKFNNLKIPSEIKIFHRKDYIDAQTLISKIKGVTAIVYDQTCAAEKRRRRKRGLYPNPNKRMFINHLVCEGCGDCGVQSNCVSITPFETELGTKRKIDQSACNKDYTCNEGFCPSFITVEGDLKPKSDKLQINDIEFENNIPEPKKLITKDVFSILLNGIGGTGVVTVAAILGMASRLEGKKFSALDMAGLAQKGGSVWSHMIISEPSKEINSPRIPNGDSDVLLGCDLVVSASKKTREILSKNTFCVVNTKKQMTGDFARNSNLTFPYKNLLDDLQGTVSENNVFLQNFSKLAEDYVGDAIFGNIILLGFAFQKGLIPLTSKSIETAIEINGVSANKNIEAFSLGRNLALKKDQIKENKYEQEKLDDFVSYRGNFLRDYQNQEYSNKYLNAIASFSNLKIDPASKEKIGKVVAQNYFKLLSYKDEYEVARLHDSAEFKKSIEDQFEKGFKIKFNLAPAIFGNKQKYQFGSWMRLFFKILKNLKFLRGTTFDIFGYTEERKTEKKLINIYEKDISYVINSFESEKFDHFVEFLNWPDQIKGYGHVKSKSIDKAIDNRKNILSIKI